MIKITPISKFTKSLALKYDYLPYMIQRYLDFLGEKQTLAMLEANEKPLIPSLRVNTLKISINKLVEKLENNGFSLKKVKHLPYGFRIIKAPKNIGSTHEFLYGFYYLQKIASMFPPFILNPSPEDLVIDMCASPGSKSTQLAQMMKNKGTLVVVEKNKNRIDALEMNIRRMGVKNSIIMNFDAINLGSLNLKADKILLDAPCTGEGLIREDRTRKKSRNFSDIITMASIQKQLLQSGVRNLKKKGQLIYSTCSIAPEENELVIDEILSDFPSVSIQKLNTQYGVSGFTEYNNEKLNPDLKFSQRFFPHIHDTIGFFLCLLQKN
ncbi:MAG: NOL1/NOP2/sun family putative RNA methylase [Candidatus Lokiarchaeota archaeon]|nr:NOL1/NOP2/sun family putative RNA methylase [Candidatus Lokiarchaeota archaeon]MBD3198998.1 NOL1/NOP2/sun family putative RNA methylase [Candidatus Lokiarchaeota archaeon]